MKYSVRIFDLTTDKDALLNLGQKLLQKPSISRFTNLYRGNSYGFASSWLLFNENNKTPVGSVSVFPRKITLDDDIVTVGVHFDMMVEKSHRTLGPALMVLRGAQKDCIDLGYQALLSFPNKRSQPVFKRLGYKKMGTAFRWSKVLHNKQKIAKIINLKILRIIICYFLDLGAKYLTYDSWIRVRHCKTRKKVIEKTSNCFSLIPDSFSDEKGLNRSSQYLSWRFDKVCQNNSKTMLLFCRNKFFGYIVYSVENNKEAVVQDIYSTSGEQGVKILLSKFIEKIYSKKVDSISILYYGSDSYSKIFRLFGFVKRDGRDVFGKILDSSIKDFGTTVSKLAWFDGDLDL